MCIYTNKKTKVGTATWINYNDHTDHHRFVCNDCRGNFHTHQIWGDMERAQAHFAGFCETLNASW